LNATGTLSTYQLTVGDNSSLLIGGQINLPINYIINIPSNSYIYGLENGILVSSLISQSTFYLNGSLSVAGNVTLGNGTVIATLNDPNSPLLLVDGYLSLAGDLKYTIPNKQKKSVKYEVMQINENFTISGTFGPSASAIEGSQVSRDLNVQTTSDTVLIIFSLEASDLPIWVWILVAVGGVILIGIIIISIVKCRSRSQYKPIR